MSQTLNLPLPAFRPLSSSSSSSRFLHHLPVNSSKKFKPSISSVVTEADPTVIDSRRKSSLYDVLQVNQNASLMEIKSAYRNLAKVYHPDSAMCRSESESESDGTDFITIHNAYETLSDPSARALYDLSLMSSCRRRRSNLSSSSAENRCSGFYVSRRENCTGVPRKQLYYSKVPKNLLIIIKSQGTLVQKFLIVQRPFYPH